VRFGPQLSARQARRGGNLIAPALSKYNKIRYSSPIGRATPTLRLATFRLIEPFFIRSIDRDEEDTVMKS
jgi:hypothetical protein